MGVRLFISAVLMWVSACAAPTTPPSDPDVADGFVSDAPRWSWAWEEPAAAPEILLTIAQIPAAMNGSVPYSADDGSTTFTLHVNRARFHLDVIASEEAGPVDWQTLEVRCDADWVDGSGAGQRAHAPMGTDRFVATEDPRASAHTRRLSVGAEDVWPDGEDVHCEATIQGPGGDASSALTFHVVTLPGGFDPFLTPDLWLVTLSRDMFRLDVTPTADGSYLVASEFFPDGDGVVDLDEALWALGLGTPEAPEVSARLKATLLHRVRETATGLFGLDGEGQPTGHGVDLRLFFEGDPGAPALEDWPGEGEGRFSAIAIGGDAKVAAQSTTLVGKAKVDWSNQGVENDTLYGLGVFTSGIVRQVLGNPLGALLLEELLPDVGQPVGTHPADELLFGDDAPPDPDTLGVELAWRQELVTFAVEMLSLAIASTLTHEMGHSMGLVPDGPPPHGLFAGIEALDFTDTFVPDGHIDTPGLNIMQTGAVTDWAEALSGTPRFNALNFAYLTRQLVITVDW